MCVGVCTQLKPTQHKTWSSVLGYIRIAHGRKLTFCPAKLVYFLIVFLCHVIYTLLSVQFIDIKTYDVECKLKEVRSQSRIWSKISFSTDIAIGAVTERVERSIDWAQDTDTQVMWHLLHLWSRMLSSFQVYSWWQISCFYSCLWHTSNSWNRVVTTNSASCCSQPPSPNRHFSQNFLFACPSAALSFFLFGGSVLSFERLTELCKYHHILALAKAKS